MPPNVPPDCQPIKDELDALHDEQQAVAEKFHDAAPSSKAGIAAEVRSVLIAIARKQSELNHCLSAHGILVPLQAEFRGEAVLETNNSKARGPFQRSVTGTLVFGYGRQTFSLSLNPFSTEPFDTPLGKNVTTVTTNAGSGTYDRASGTVVVSLILFFDHSVSHDNVAGGAFAGDSVLRIDVATNKPGGSPLDASGAITLVGDGVFENGFLGGNTAHITIRGSVQPLP